MYFHWAMIPLYGHRWMLYRHIVMKWFYVMSFANIIFWSNEIACMLFYISFVFLYNMFDDDEPLRFEMKRFEGICYIRSFVHDYLTYCVFQVIMTAWLNNYDIYRHYGFIEHVHTIWLNILYWFLVVWFQTLCLIIVNVL